MSTLSVTNVLTGNGTTDLTISTGNTSNPGIVLSSSNGTLFVGNSSYSVTRTIYITGANSVATARFENFANGTAINAVSNTGIGIYAQSNTGTIANFTNATSTIASVTQTGVSLGTNNLKYSFTPLAGGANVYLIQQNDDNFVFYSTNTINQPRAVFSIFANSVTSNVSFAVPVQVGGNLTVTTNTLTLGSSTNAAAGFTILPNGFKMNWGTVVSNSVGQNVVTFASPFTTNAYSVQTTAIATINAAGTRHATINATGFTVISANATGAATNTGITGIQYLAIGPA